MDHGEQGGSSGPDLDAIAEGVLAAASAIGELASSSGSEGSDGPSREDDAAPPSFNERRALLALGEVNLSPCLYRGAPRGSGRARVTFRSDGAVTGVEILSPGGMSAEAIACITDGLSDATAPRFSGPPTDVRTEFRVREPPIP